MRSPRNRHVYNMIVSRWVGDGRACKEDGQELRHALPTWTLSVRKHCVDCSTPLRPLLFSRICVGRQTSWRRCTCCPNNRTTCRRPRCSATLPPPSPSPPAGIALDPKLLGRESPSHSREALTQGSSSGCPARTPGSRRGTLSTVCSSIAAWTSSPDSSNLGAR